MAEEMLAVEARLIDFMSPNFKIINANMKKFTNNVKQSFDKADKRSDKLTQTMGRLKTAFIGLGAAMLIKRGVASTTREFIAFEKRMAEVNTIARQTEEGLRGTTRAIVELSKRVPKSADELGAGLYQVLSAGIKDVGDAMVILEESTRLAVGGVADVGSTVKVVTGIINAYGLEADEVTRVSDILFKTVENGVTTIAELATQLGQVIPVARAAGVGIEEVTAAVATLTAAGVKTSIATTGLRAAIFSLSAPTEQAQKEMDRLNIVMKDNLLDTIIQFQGLDLAALRELIPEKEAAAAVITLANNYKKFGDNVSAAFKAGGSASKAFNTQMETADSKLKIIANRLKQMGFAIGEGFAKLATGAAQTVTTTAGVVKYVIANTALAKSFKDLSELTTKHAESITDIGEATKLIGRVDKKIGEERAKLFKERNLFLQAEDKAALDRIQKRQQEIRGEVIGLTEIKRILQSTIDLRKKEAADARKKIVEGKKPPPAGPRKLTDDEREQILAARKRLEESKLLLIEDADRRAFEQLKLAHQMELEEVGNNFAARKLLEETHLIDIQAFRDEINRKTLENIKKNEDEFVKIKNEGLARSEKIDKQQIASTKAWRANLVGSIGTVLNAMGNLMEQMGANAAAMKAIRTFEVVVNTAAAIMRAMADLGPVIGGITAVAIGIQGAAQLAAIQNAKFAEGTDSAPGGPSLVGERGPEIVNLPQGAQVINNTETRNILEGNRNNITIVVDDVGTFEDKVLGAITTLNNDGRLVNFRQDFREGGSS